MSTSNTSFGDFVGKKVKVIEGRETLKLKSGDVVFDTFTVSDDDTVISSVTAAIEACGYTVRVWLPDTVGTMDHVLTRYNVHVVKDEGGGFRIQTITPG